MPKNNNDDFKLKYFGTQIDNILLEKQNVKIDAKYRTYDK